jgi:hypothetical protein
VADQDPVGPDASGLGGGFAMPIPVSVKPPPEYTDGRDPWDWKSRYSADARSQINGEAFFLAGLLLVMLISAGLCLGIAGPRDYFFTILGADVHVSFRLLALFFTGCVGGTTFSIKWLIHSVAKGKWHLDRRYWRLLVPAIGGVYACVVMTLFGAGLFASQSAAATAGPMPGTAALAFLVGYFSDGVSGLLSNVANAVFGTLEKK